MLKKHVKLSRFFRICLLHDFIDSSCCNKKKWLISLYTFVQLILNPVEQYEHAMANGKFDLAEQLKPYAEGFADLQAEFEIEKVKPLRLQNPIKCKEISETMDGYPKTFQDYQQQQVGWVSMSVIESCVTYIFFAFFVCFLYCFEFHVIKTIGVEGKRRKHQGRR